MTKSDQFLAYELTAAITETDTWDAVVAEDPFIQEATNKFRVVLSRLGHPKFKPYRDLRDAISSATWSLVNAYTQAASLYGYHVSQVLQGAVGRPQELTAYMKETEAGGEAV